jgi:hypothetical protein
VTTVEELEQAAGLAVPSDWRKGLTDRCLSLTDNRWEALWLAVEATYLAEQAIAERRAAVLQG